MKHFVLAASVFGLLVATGCSSSQQQPQKHDHTIHGTLTATVPFCFGGPGSVNGNTVEIRNENNTLIGTAVLPTLASIAPGNNPPTSTSCVEKFTIPSVPDAKIYQFKIGTRTGPDYTLAQMQQKHWTVALTLTIHSGLLPMA